MPALPHAADGLEQSFDVQTSHLRLIWSGMEPGILHLVMLVLLVKGPHSEGQEVGVLTWEGF